MTMTMPERKPDLDPDTEEAFEAVSAAAPGGWRVELIDGEIYVSPPANAEHEEYVSEVQHQTSLRSKDDRLRVLTGIGLVVPGATGTGKVIPDAVIVHKGSLDPSESYHDPSPVLLVCEVTSKSTGDIDRVRKLHGYALAGIPSYLLVDRDAGMVTLHSQPAGSRYEQQLSVPIGRAVPLPEPLGFELDTGEF